MPRDDLPFDPFDNEIHRDRDPSARPGLPDRVFVGPEMFRTAIRSVTEDIRRRGLRGMLYTIELTSIGATGRRAAEDEEALLDNLAEMLIALFRGSDLVARTGDLSFAVVATPVPDAAADALTHRLSDAIESLLREWRRHGVVTCCAVSQQPIDAGHVDHCAVFFGRTRHVLHDVGLDTPDTDPSHTWRHDDGPAATSSARIIPLADFTGSSGSPT
ncbi:MAG: GGDEF domain-containing protein [Rhodospirillales bacterium]